MGFPQEKGSNANVVYAMLTHMKHIIMPNYYFCTGKWVYPTILDMFGFIEQFSQIFQNIGRSKI